MNTHPEMAPGSQAGVRGPRAKSCGKLRPQAAWCIVDAVHRPVVCLCDASASLYSHLVHLLLRTWLRLGKERCLCSQGSKYRADWAFVLPQVLLHEQIHEEGTGSPK